MEKCKIGYDGGLVTWISAKPTVWTPEVNYYTSGIMAEKFSIMRRTSCSSLSRVLSTRSSCFTSPTSPTSLSQDYENFIMCPATIRSDNMSEQAQGDLLQTQSQDDEQGWNPLPPELPWGKGVTGREFTLTSWKTEIAKCRRARTTWTLCKRRTGEAIPRAANFGKTDNSRAQSLNWDLWIGNQSPIRYRGSKFGSLKIRDETLLEVDMELFPGIWH